MTVIGSGRSNRATLAAARGEAELRKLARSFDCRSVNTNIIRAVWDKAHRIAGEINSQPFPILADGNYGIDHEDFAGRFRATQDQHQNLTANPCWQKVDSLKD